MYDALVTGTGTPYDEIGDYPTFTFGKSDFIQGNFLIIDGARTVEHNRVINNAVCLDWSKAPKIPVEGYTLQLKGALLLDYSFVTLTGDTPQILEQRYKSVASVPVADKVSVVIQRTDKGDLSVSDLNDGLQIMFSRNFATYPNGDEKYSTPIASFVEIAQI